MEEDVKLDAIAVRQRKILSDFRELYFDIKYLTNNYPETTVPKLKDGRIIVNAIDDNLRQKLRLEKEKQSLTKKLATIDKTYSSLSGNFFPCLVGTRKMALISKIDDIAVEAKRLDAELPIKYEVLFALCLELIPIKFKLENPAPSRFTTPAPSRTSSMVNVLRS